MRSKSAQDGTQDGPRSPQDGSKIVLDRFFCLLNFRFVFASFLVPFWCRFGLPNGSPGVGANYANRPLGGSKTVLGSSWFGPFFVLRFGFVFWSLLGASWCLLGVHLGSFWAFWKASWGRFGVSGCILVLLGATKKHLLVDSTHEGSAMRID